MTFFRWFFWETPRDILQISRNFMLWAWKFFSISYFPPRLFAPWHKDITFYGRGFDLKRFLHTFGWNLISRVIGAILRIFVISAGICVEIIFVVAGIAAFVFWFLMPIVAVALIFLGLVTLLL